MGGKILLFVNKKKQKNFVTLGLGAPPLYGVIPAALSLDRWYRARVGGRRAQNKDSYQPPKSLVTSQNFERLV